MLVQIRNMTPTFTLTQFDERLYFLEWVDDTGLFRRQTYNRFDVDKNFQSGIWTMV